MPANGEQSAMAEENESKVICNRSHSVLEGYTKRPETSILQEGLQLQQPVGEIKINAFAVRSFDAYLEKNFLSFFLDHDSRFSHLDHRAQELML